MFIDKYWKNHKNNVNKMKSDLIGVGEGTSKLMDDFRFKHKQA